MVYLHALMLVQNTMKFKYTTFVQAIKQKQEAELAATVKKSVQKKTKLKN